ncbi:hypothetical protein BC943DRAFT_201593 [Umbelopsis sp. AD052]|nr:hypothetical protein BC943DRAFT_201593 [Umbelopsis sp. AD052]
MSSPIILCRVKALYTFDGTEPTALSFSKGDSIDVLAQLDSGWWDGWCNGKRGWFPSNYVEVIDELSEDLEVDQQDGLELGGLMSDRRSSRELQTQRISTTAAVPLDIKHHRLSFTGMASDDPKSDSSNSYEQQTLLLDNASELPPGWRLQLTDNGHVFYNEVTGDVRHNLEIDESNGSISESAEDDELLDQSEQSQSQSRDSQSHQSRDSLSQGGLDSQSHQSRDSLSQSRDSQSHQSRDSQSHYREDNERSVYSESMDESSVFEVGMSNTLDAVTLPEHWVSEVTPQGRTYFRHQVTNDIAWDMQSLLHGTQSSSNSVRYSIFLLRSGRAAKSY